MSRCHLTQFDRLEPVLILSLLTLLDKSKDGDWKKDTVSKGDILDDLDTQPIPKKAQQKKQKAELLNDQKLQLMVNKDVRRSQKQIQLDEKYSMSAGNSPAHSPKGSPLPTPSSSASQLNTKDQSLKASSHGKLARLFNSLSTYQQDNEPVSRDQSLEKHYDHQSSLPAGYVYRDNPPPSLKSIQWDTKKKFSGSLDYQTKVPYSNRHSTSEYYYQ
ncbi:uncharacterized protein B0P05DRAFT_570795 [Gilbertella persicaria]|uniref:uncharacterized protein n=1 Tax=Gilbertella persicaria TaxID=101096 RepID=UPI00221E3D1A|nr:uncharacterized protein B0P05DRAFT_570795 [Gilbertella persicaria]KAI8082558.1 hypothetical protein B0P05DRAFT_570795 [Gilbertella persicaria]